MQNAIFRCIQFKDPQAITLDFIAVGIAVLVLANSPFLCHLKAVCAIKAETVIIVGLAVSKQRFLNDI